MAPRSSSVADAPAVGCHPTPGRCTALMHTGLPERSRTARQTGSTDGVAPIGRYAWRSSRSRPWLSPIASGRFDSVAAQVAGEWSFPLTAAA
jgi:hypothetical protein